MNVKIALVKIVIVRRNKMKKFLMGVLLIGGLVGQDIPEPSIVGTDLIRPTLTVSKFVNTSEL